MATVMFDTGKKDYTAEVSSLIIQIETTVNDTGISLKTCTSLAHIQIYFVHSIGIDDAITALLVMEKKCRVNNDFINLTVISKFMLKLCKQTLNWY